LTVFHFHGNLERAPGGGQVRTRAATPAPGLRRGSLGLAPASGRLAVAKEFLDRDAVRFGQPLQRLAVRLSLPLLVHPDAMFRDPGSLSGFGERHGTASLT